LIGEALAVADSQSGTRFSGLDSSLYGSETILVVDDESLVRDLCSTVLTSAGYKVLAAEDGFRALTLCKAAQSPVHLALVDVRMPGMSGPELIELLDCVVPLNLEIRFILMSGYADPGMLNEENDSQRRCSFLSKPFTASTLLEAVRRELDAVQQHAAAS
jgi:two-component system cell cycle sensor histidine kinase/response regulator CckA